MLFIAQHRVLSNNCGMRNVPIAADEYYHIFNRGNNHRSIFNDNLDRARFLFCILAFQSSKSFYHIGRSSEILRDEMRLYLNEKTFNFVSTNRFVELINFCLMPNHFHLTLYCKEEGGISRYMQKVLNAYTKYFNTRYKLSGHLFQGPYQAIPISSNEQLLHLSAYIHRNPIDLREWRNKIFNYPWSSLQDYANTNRWGGLLKPDIVIEQFSNPEDYEKFIETSSAKAYEKLDDSHLIVE